MSEPHALICYAIPDQAFVDRLQADLEAAGLKTKTRRFSENGHSVTTQTAILIVSPNLSGHVQLEAERVRLVWAGGDDIPPILQNSAYVDARGDRYRQGVAKLIAALKEEPRNPYVGLRPCTDERDFFGREALLDELLAALFDAEQFLALVGPSGVGKSSIVRAGLLPRLKGSDRWIYTEDPTAVRPEESRRTVLFIDRLERLLSQDDDVLNSVLSHKNTLILSTLRADFYGQALSHPVLGALIRDNSYAVPPMTTDELRTAIEKPAARAGLEFEGDLVEQLLAIKQPLPLVQFTLDQLFAKRDGHRLTLAAYREASTLADYTESIYETLPSEAHEIGARVLFLRLLELNESVISRPVALDTLDATLADVANHFIEAKLLTANEAMLELSHEVLIQEWPRLADWIEIAREDVRTQQMLRRDIAMWKQHAKHPKYLYRGLKLARAVNWSASPTNDPTPEELDFIQLSTKAEETGKHRNEVLKNAIVRNVSHELNTPLVQVKGAVALLVEDSSNEVLNHYALQATARLELLVRNVTMLSHSLSYNPGPVIVRDIMIQVRRNIDRPWERLGTIDRIKLDLPDNLPPVHADRQGITTVLELLIDNGLKFSKGAVEVGAAPIEDGERVTFWVKDGGIGISQEQFEAIFDPFYKVDSSSTQSYGGIGVGLSLAQQVLYQHESFLSVESELGVGSTFYFELPIA